MVDRCKNIKLTLPLCERATLFALDGKWKRTTTLELMNKYENYHFVPMKPTERQDYNLFSSESGLTLLVSNTLPPFMLEIRRPELSQACHEYLMRTADLVGYTGIRRTKIRMQIKELIQELRR